MRNHEVAKRVVAFARYPESRPEQLLVGDENEMWASNLFGCWGKRHFENCEALLEALRENAFDKDGTRRIELCHAGAADDVKIFVRAKRGKPRYFIIYSMYYYTRLYSIIPQLCHPTYFL